MPLGVTEMIVLIYPSLHVCANGGEYPCVLETLGAGFLIIGVSDKSLGKDRVLYFPTCTHLRCKISHFRLLNNIARILVIISTEGSVWFSVGEGH